MERIKDFIETTLLIAFSLLLLLLMLIDHIIFRVLGIESEEE